jgi:hypothetical protein
VTGGVLGATAEVILIRFYALGIGLFIVTGGNMGGIQG